MAIKHKYSLVDSFLFPFCSLLHCQRKVTRNILCNLKSKLQTIFEKKRSDLLQANKTKVQEETGTRRLLTTIGGTVGAAAGGVAALVYFGPVLIPTVIGCVVCGGGVGVSTYLTKDNRLEKKREKL